VDTKELKEYLGYVLETENDIYALKVTLAKTEKHINSLGHTRNIQLAKDAGLEKRFFSVAFLLFWTTFFGLCIMALFWAIGSLFSVAFEGSTLVLIGVMSAAGAFICGIATNISVRKANKNYNAEVQAQYLNAQIQDNIRVANELVQKNDARNYHTTITNQLEETEQILKKLYDLNIINPEYRGLRPISMFYQYFDTDRCMTLSVCPVTGHEGAYNLYEAEKQRSTITSQLNTVIDHLETIKDTQAREALEQTVALLASGKLSDEDNAYLHNEIQAIYLESKERAQKKFSPKKFRDSTRPRQKEEWAI